MADSTEKILCQYLATGLIRKLNLDESQASISPVKILDPAWLSQPHYQIIPGAVVPDGGGKGAQEGGSMIRRQEFSIVYYDKLKLDQHGLGAQTLINAADGTLDAFEDLRNLLALVYFDDPANNTSLLTEPLQVVRESATTWEDQENGIFSREFVWTCQYSVELPQATTLNLIDVL